MRGMGHEENGNVNHTSDVITCFSEHKLLHWTCKEVACAVRRS